MVPTVIKSSKDNKHEILVEYYTLEEFEKNLADLKIEKDGAIKARSEFTAITKIALPITGTNKIVLFISLGSLDRMKAKLQELITDENKALSIKQVTVRTNHIKTEIPLEIHDLPGIYVLYTLTL